MPAKGRWDLNSAFRGRNENLKSERLTDSRDNYIMLSVNVCVLANIFRLRLSLFLIFLNFNPFSHFDFL